MSYQDFIRIVGHLCETLGPDFVVHLLYGDGQSVIGLKNLIRT